MLISIKHFSLLRRFWRVWRLQKRPARQTAGGETALFLSRPSTVAPLRDKPLYRASNHAERSDRQSDAAIAKTPRPPNGGRGKPLYFCPVQVLSLHCATNFSIEQATTPSAATVKAMPPSQKRRARQTAGGGNRFISAPSKYCRSIARQGQSFLPRRYSTCLRKQILLRCTSNK